MYFCKDIFCERGGLVTPEKGVTERKKGPSSLSASSDTSNPITPLLCLHSTTQSHNSTYSVKRVAGLVAPEKGVTEKKGNQIKR